MNHHGMFSFYYREARQAWTESPPNIMELPREDMPDSNSNISDIPSPHSDMIHITSPPRSQRTQQRQSRPSRREQATNRMRLSLGSLENVDLGKALDFQLAAVCLYINYQFFPLVSQCVSISNNGKLI